MVCITSQKLIAPISLTADVCCNCCFETYNNAFCFSFHLKWSNGYHPHIIEIVFIFLLLLLLSEICTCVFANFYTYIRYLKWMFRVCVCVCVFEWGITVFLLLSSCLWYSHLLFPKIFATLTLILIGPGIIMKAHYTHTHTHTWPRM